MPIRVATIDLSAAIVGMSFVIPFGQASPPPTLAQQMQPLLAGPSTLKIYNESGVGLRATWPLNNQTFTIPAGQWPTLYPPPNETQLNVTATYILPNAPVNQLAADLFLPGEQVYATGALGNSPVNGGALVGNLTANFLKGVGQSFSLTELDTIAGDPMLLPTNGAGQDLHLGARDGGNTAIEVVDISATLGSELTVLAGDGSAGQGSIRANDITLTGQALKVNNIATSGKFGVGALVLTGSATVAVTTLVTTHTYTPAVAGDFMIGATFRLNNGTPGQPVTLQLVYNDGFSGAAQNHKFQIVNTTTYAAANAVALGNAVFACTPLTIFAAAGSPILVQFRDNGGTPNDTIRAFYMQVN